MLKNQCKKIKLTNSKINTMNDEINLVEYSVEVGCDVLGFA